MLKKYFLALLAAIALYSSSLQSAIAARATGAIVVESETPLIPGLPSASELLVANEKVWKMRKIITALVKIGQYDRAIQFAKTVDDPNSQALALSSLALDFSEVKEFARAQQILETLMAAPLKPEVAMQLQSSTLTEIALALAKDKQFDRAQQLTQRIPHPFAKEVSVFYVAINLVADGQIDRALQLTEKMTEPRFKSFSLQSIATILVVIGKEDRARSVIRSLPDLSALKPSPEIKNSLLDGESEYWGSFLYGFPLSNFNFPKIQQPDRVASALSIIPNQSLRTETLGRMTVTPTRDEKSGDVLRLIRDLPDNKERDERLHQIAFTLIIEGELESALQAANLITDSIQKSDALSAIAAATVYEKGIDSALQLVSEFSDSEARNLAVPQIAIAATYQGNIDRALQLLEPISAAERDSALSTMTMIIADRGNPDRALQLLALISDLELKDIALSEIINGLLAQGNINRAQQLLESISAPEAKNTAFGGIINAMFKQGNIERASQLLDSITNGENKADANTIQSIALTLAERGEIDRAYQLLQGLSDEKERTDAIDWTTRDLFESGNYNFALQFSRKVGDKTKTFNLLLSIVEQLTENGQKERALTILEEAITLI